MIEEQSDTTVLLDYTQAGGWNVLPDFAPTDSAQAQRDKATNDALEGAAVVFKKTKSGYAVKLGVREMISVTSEGNESDINSLQHALTDAIGCVEFYKKESDASQAQRNTKDKQLADCYDRMNKAEAQRDKALVALNSIREYWNEDRNDKAMFDACWFAINTAESVLKECWKPKVEK